MILSGVAFQAVLFIKVWSSIVQSQLEPWRSPFGSKKVTCTYNRMWRLLLYMHHTYIRCFEAFDSNVAT